ncbi:Amino acid/polyamine transporter I [Acididesulfobacillus acetoxydans]|uniref:Amino acid permease protein n=1 Tax=Acididesulfobacillus acetoxydans TaxID=1561005 RepID=A0A8S0X4T0_9FIRM|nr:APC family permease [Acididesulfobacillus acetoxydans]CAA7601060.1 Amino acid/polyamine transporter I [Acididesulfobacillus acetoxydans]CEJ06934.1 Amino acid permease protein [Acididesulfobacillus acetoxydans]
MAHNNRLFWLKLRTFMFGHPLATNYAEHTRVGVLGGIPIFGSDIISSEGYAPDEILYILLLAGAVGYAYVLQVSIVIILLLASIIMVYRKAIQKYPQGGGSYTIAKAYLGESFGLIAASSLTLDYVLTVAVSVSSAIDNLTGVLPWLAAPDHKVIADCLVILFMAWINLRGLRESARLFSVPVYLYISVLVLLVGTGVVEIMFHGVNPVKTTRIVEPALSGMTWFLFARAVAGGTTALTGIEAVSNGVTAFKAPSQKRAIRTLLVLGAVVAVGLSGLVYLAGSYHLVPSANNTILNQLGLLVFGRTVLYFVLIGSAAAILVIAANTPFAGLPILLSLMARDGYAPRYFKNLGDRLVYSVGIWTLMLVSLFLILIFHGDTHLMLPLYAIGVLLSFSLTGIGLARHTQREKEGTKWRSDLAVFAFGGILSFLVFVVFITTKFTQGAWIVLVILPILFLIFRTICCVYRGEMAEIQVTPAVMEDFRLHVAKVKRRRAHVEVSEYRNKIIVPVYDLNVVVLKALKYAYSLTPLVTAVHVGSDPDRVNKLLRHWAENHMEIPLEIVDSPYRATVHDFLGYLDKVEKKGKYDTITVAIPELVPQKMWHNILHNQTGQLIKLMLLLRKSILVTSVPYHPLPKESQAVNLNLPKPGLGR